LIGTSPVWLGHESLQTFVAVALGLLLYAVLPMLCRRLAPPHAVQQANP
jgi:hypothetical protein